METLEIKTTKGKINQNGYIDLSKCNDISVLLTPNEPKKFKSWDEYIEWKNKTLGEDVVEEYLDLNRFETIPALDRALAEIDNGECSLPMTFEEYLEETKRWFEEDEEI